MNGVGVLDTQQRIGHALDADLLDQASPTLRERREPAPCVGRMTASYG